MRRTMVIAAVLATVAMPGELIAQATMPVPYGGTRPAPVPQTPPLDPKDTPEEIAKDAARDLTPTHFYNRPGATRAEYDAAWQACRLIARGSRTPSGSVPYYYNPALVSPIAAGIGGGLGGLLAGAIAEGAQRRANRQNCMLIRGWRLIEPNDAQAAPVIAMTEAARTAHLDAQIGAMQPTGTPTERTSFTLAPDPALRLDAPVVGPASLFLGKKVDPAAPFVLAPGEAAIVVAFRRPDPGSAGRSGRLELMRYDSAGRDLVYRPRDWKKQGDKTTYSVSVASGDRKAPYEVQVVRITPGDYVLNSWASGTLLPTTTNCFGAPNFHVAAGEVLFLGDFIPYWDVKLASGAKFSDLVYAGQTGDARGALQSRQPTLATALRPAAWRNNATYACSAITMTRFDLTGASPLPEAVPAPATTTATTG